MCFANITTLWNPCHADEYIWKNPRVLQRLRQLYHYIHCACVSVCYSSGWRYSKTLSHQTTGRRWVFHCSSHHVPNSAGVGWTLQQGCRRSLCESSQTMCPGETLLKEICECGVMMLGKQVHTNVPYLYLYWDVLQAGHCIVLHFCGSCWSQCAGNWKYQGSQGKLSFMIMLHIKYMGERVSGFIFSMWKGLDYCSIIH
jgi:hypothetical protein